MANVMHHIDFHPRPVSHAPSPFGFGFGLGPNASNPIASSSWGTPTPGHTNVAAFQHLASSINQSAFRPPKRRHEFEDDLDAAAYTGARDESMDRSPTPERPKRAAPKRARIIATIEADKENATSADNKSSQDDDVDVGVLLASLPTQSLLPLLTALLKAQPSLKSTIVPLIPRPTLDTALQAVAQSAKKLREAYPYSNSPSSSQGSFGFGRTHGSSGQGTQQHNSQGGMRDSYIISRLRPHIADFVSCCISYLPYFTCILSPTQPPTSSQLTTTIQSLHKDKFHPSETFIFLSAVTGHLLSQPSLATSSIAPLLLPRLAEEWKSWVDRVDEVVNRQAGMFGSETVRSWERGLDELAEAKATEVSTSMRQIRDRWVMKVGWLVGRTVQHAMDEV